MAVIQAEPEQVEEIEILLPEQPNGANALIIVTGRVPTRYLEASGEGAPAGTSGSSPSQTYIFNAGLELDPAQIRSVRATATVTSIYGGVTVPSTPPPAGPGMEGGDFRWSLGAVDAVHDDDERRARVSVNASVLARFGAWVRVESIGFELRILVRR
jgi:hypothetical protein